MTNGPIKKFSSHESLNKSKKKPRKARVTLAIEASRARQKELQKMLDSAEKRKYDKKRKKPAENQK